MKILVTGGAGFIGSHVVDALIARNHQVIIVDSLSTGRKINLNNKAVFYKLDINSSIIEEIFKTPVEMIIHLAAQTSVPLSVLNPLSDAQVNIIGSLHLLKLAKHYGVKKFIYINSAAIFGQPIYLPLDEQHPQEPLSAYGISKSVVEKYLQFSGLNYLSLRLANVYGPRQVASAEGGVIAAFIHQCLAQQSPIIHGNGQQTRDFVFVKDVVTAILCALEFKPGGCFNIGSGTETSINQLYQTICQLTLCQQLAQTRSVRVGDIERSVFNINKAKQLLHWEPETKLRDGLMETINYEKTKNIRSDLRI